MTFSAARRAALGLAATAIGVGLAFSSSARAADGAATSQASPQTRGLTHVDHEARQTTTQWVKIDAALVKQGKPASGPATAPASKPASATTSSPASSAERTDDIFIEVTFDKKFYLPTEDVFATVTFRTHSEKPLELTGLSPVAWNSSLELKAEGPDGKELKYLGMRGGNAARNGVVSADKWLATVHSLREMFNLDAPGDYDVTAVYDDLRSANRTIVYSQPVRFSIAKPDGMKVISTFTGSDRWHADYEIVQFKIKEKMYYLARQHGAARGEPNVRIAHSSRIEAEGLDKAKIADAVIQSGDTSCWLIELPEGKTLALVLGASAEPSCKVISRKTSDLKIKRESGEQYAPLYIEDSDGKRIDFH